MAACGGGGGGDGGGGNGQSSGDDGAGASSVDVAGTWTITQSFEDNCEDGDATETLVLTVMQDGDSLTVVDELGNSFSGTIDGNTISWTGSYPEDGGTTTITSLTATVDGDTMSGTSTWTWSDSTFDCEGTTEFTGTRASAGAPADVGGTWTITQSFTDDCDDGDATETLVLTITQDGDSLTVVDEHGNSFSGTIDGNTVTWSGSYPEDGGTTTITSLTATVDGDTLSGTSTWTWSDSTFSCSGTTSFTGTRSSDGALAAPSDLTAEAQNWNSVELNWADNSGNEIGFTIERSEDGGATFAEVGEVAGDTTTYVDSDGLEGSTSYSYRVRAYNGDTTSDFSNVVSVTTPAESSASPPSAPTTLSAEPIDHGEIELEWTDNAVDEDGFIVERRTSSTEFAELVRTEPNGVGDPAATGVVAYSDTTVLDSTTYTYRVRAFSAAGESDPSNDAVATTPAAPAETFELSLATAGDGSGNVAGPGLNCGSVGSDCAETFESGTEVTLTATEDDGSSFVAWDGCTAQADPNECVLEVTDDTVVTAEFGHEWNLAATLSLPETDDDGTYDLSWTWAGIAQTPVFIEEAPDTTFTSVTSYTHNDISTSYTFADKPDGTYCYRLNLSSGYTEPACITVLRPEASEGVLKITNDSSYNLVSIELNDTELLSAGQVLAAGANADLLLTPGTANLQIANGYYACSTCAPTQLFTLSTTETIEAGQTTEVVFPNPTIEQLLSKFGSSHVWKGEWFDASANMHFAAFEFASDGSWTLWQCPVFGTPEAVGSGSGVSLQSWPAYSPYVEFRIGSEPEDLLLNAADGFSSFKMTNGPSSWPIIEYTAGLGGGLCTP